MNKLTLLGSVGAICAGAVCTASAITQNFSDINTYSPAIQFNADGGRTTFTDVFDLTANGFVPGTDIATSGKAIFNLSNGGPGNSARVTIDLGSIAEVTGGFVQNYTFTFGASDVSILTDINADGKISYTIVATAKHFQLDSAELDIVATVKDSTSSTTDTRVPDGGTTVALLGSSLVGISLLKRKFGIAK